MKTCSRCKERKVNELFPKDKTTKDGYSFYCKLCIHDKYKKRRADEILGVAKHKRRSRQFLVGKLEGLQKAREQFKEQNFDMVMIQNSFNFYKSIDTEISKINLELELKK